MKFFRGIAQTLAAMVVMLTSSVHPTSASVGLAEWEVKTPGGNFVGNNDWYPNCGTCLISRLSEDTPDGSKTLASQLQWWQYYSGYVTGQSAEGFFLLHERSKAIQFFHTQPELDRAIRDRRLLPTSKPLTAQDGWNQVWGPILQESCRRAKTC